MTLANLVEVVGIEPELYKIVSTPGIIIKGKLIGTINFCVDDAVFNPAQAKEHFAQHIPATANAYELGTISSYLKNTGQRIYFYNVDLPEKK